VEAGESPALYRNCKSEFLTSQETFLSKIETNLLGLRRKFTECATLRDSNPTERSGFFIPDQKLF
jgi:hypothetical protein